MQDEKEEKENLKLRDEGIDYLIKSNFITALVKKSIFNNLINDYLDDYVQECWVAILEQKDEVWEKLYQSSIDKGTDYHYEIRNYFSRIVFNVVKSKSSNAYRKLIKPNLTEKIQTVVQWDVYESTIADENGISETILNQNDQEAAN